MSMAARPVAGIDAAGPASASSALADPAEGGDEVPHSTGPTGLLPILLGPVIALATVIVPLATVISSAQHVDVTPHLLQHGPDHAGGLPATRADEPGGAVSSH